MTHPDTVAAELVHAMAEFPDLPALSDDRRSLSYADLGRFVAAMGPRLDAAATVGTRFRFRPDTSTE